MKMKTVAKRLSLTAVLLLAICGGCSRKAQPVAPPTPEVLVITVMPKDVPVLKEAVATLEGFITANINAQVQGYIISRDYKEGSLVKKGDFFFKSILAPFKQPWIRRRDNWLSRNRTRLRPMPT
jgi:membrane fusion protein, multidrug efflux system